MAIFNSYVKLPEGNRGMKRMAHKGRQRASPSALGSTFMTSSSGYQRPPFFVSTLGCDVPGSYHLITLC